MGRQANEPGVSVGLNIGAVRWSGVASIVRATAAFLQLFLLARILGPETYGTVALTGVVVGFVLLLGDLGVNAALIQRQNIDDCYRTANFWVGLIINTLLAIALYHLAPLIGEFFRDVDLVESVAVVSMAFWVSSLGSQHKAWAEKNFLFGRVLVVEGCASVVGAVVAIWTAMTGFGALAFAMGMLASGALSSLLAWSSISPGWRPVFRFPVADLRDSLTFGGKLVSLRLVSYLFSSADTLYSGRMLGASDLGLYMGGRNIVLQAQSLVNPAVTRVGFPAVAAAKHDRAKIRALYLQSLNFAASLNAPVVAFFFFFGHVFGSVFLGAAWEASGEIFKILAIWSAASSTLNIGSILVMGSGRLLLAVMWGLLRLSLLCCAFLWSGVSTSTGIATLMAIVSVLFIAPGWLIIARPISGVAFGEFLITALRPFLLGAVSFLCVSMLALPLDGIVPLLGNAILALAIYAALSFAFNREFLLDVTALFRPVGASK